MDQILRDRTAGSGTRDASAPTVPGDVAVETDAPRKEAAMPTLATVGLGEDEYQGRDTLTYKKPPMDIFKAIFADSDDDDSDEEDEPNALAGTSSSKKPDEQSANSALSAASVKPVLEPPEIVTPVPMTVDCMASFKPTFVSKSDRSTADKQENGKDKKAKKKVKKSSAVVSFELEDGEGAADSVGAPKETKSKKRKAEEKERKVKKEKKANGQMEAQAGEEEDEWVEKEAHASAAVPPSAHGAPNGHTAPRGQRVRASELF
jgi:G patch domain-containing protein 1